MPTTTLTSLSIERLSSDRQTRYMDASLRGFGVLVSRTTKTFIVITGKERKLTTLGRFPAMSLKDARQEARRILAHGVTDGPRTSYADAIEDFLKAKEGVVKPRTLEVYRYYLNTLGFSGDVRSTTKQEVRKALAVFDGKPRAQNACFACARTFFYWCSEEDLIDKSPIYRGRMPNAQSSRKRVLSDEEIVKIWNATDVKPYGYLVRLLLLTAARKMEVRRLIVEGDHLIFKDTKNKTDHTLPLTPLVREHLLDAYTFNNWQREKERLDARSKVTGWTIHDLRRTWATLAGRLGVRPETIERVLNHKRQGIEECRRRSKSEPPCRSNIEPGAQASFLIAGCG